MPWMRLVMRVAPVSKAPVEPADTKASPPPSRSMVSPTPIEVSFFRLNTVAGSSHISTVCEDAAISIPAGSSRRPHCFKASRIAVSSPVSTMSTPQRFCPASAPFTISRGALSPPMASRIIFIRQVPPLVLRQSFPRNAPTAERSCFVFPSPGGQEAE